MKITSKSEKDIMSYGYPLTKLVKFKNNLRNLYGEAPFYI